MLTLGDAVFKSRNSTSIMNFPVNGTSIPQTKSSLFFSCLSVIAAERQNGNVSCHGIKIELEHGAYYDADELVKTLNDVVHHSLTKKLYYRFWSAGLDAIVLKHLWLPLALQGMESRPVPFQDSSWWIRSARLRELIQQHPESRDGS